MNGRRESLRLDEILIVTGATVSDAVAAAWAERAELDIYRVERCRGHPQETERHWQVQGTRPLVRRCESCGGVEWDHVAVNLVRCVDCGGERPTC